MAVIHDNNGPILEKEGLGIIIGTNLAETYFPDVSQIYPVIYPQIYNIRHSEYKGKMKFDQKPSKRTNRNKKNQLV